jgi:carbon-monoxide dehydrogenase large subunit
MRPLSAPHAHARITGVDTAGRQAMEGVIAVLTGAELKPKTGSATSSAAGRSRPRTASPMNMGAWPALAAERVRYVGDAVAVVIAETQAQARDRRRGGGGRLRGTARRRPRRQGAGSGAPQVHDNAPGNLIYRLGDRRRGRDRCGAGRRGPCHRRMALTNNRLSPNAMEPRAAIATYDAAEDHYTLYTTSQNPHVARLVLSALLQRRARAQAARDRARCRRRLRLEDLHLSRRDRLPLGVDEDRALGQVDRRPVGGVHDRRPWPRPRHHRQDGFDADNKITGFKVDTIANFGAYMSLFSQRGADLSLCHAAVGPVRHPGIYCNVRAVYTNTVPVDAYRGAGRPEATYVVERMMETAAREMGLTRPSCAARTSSPSSRTRRRSS